MQAHPRTTTALVPRDPSSATTDGSNTPWQDLHLEQRWNKGRQDFTFGKVLGVGAFGTVVLGQEVATSREFAIKILHKKKIMIKKKESYVTRELDIMARLDHPFCVKLHCAFQDDEKLYVVLNYAKNGDLQRFVEKVGRLDEPCTRFYSAEIVSALEYLHGLDIIHRDLKPHNILLKGDMHIQIADFGLAKTLSPCDEQARANSLVGTPSYVSPEVLLKRGACKSSDLWALGCVIYKLLTGRSPFQTSEVYLTYHKIAKLDYDFPEYFPRKAKDLVRNLLVLESTDRLGCEEMGGYGALKMHPFFRNITWDNLHLQTPPTVPQFLGFPSEDKKVLGNLDTAQGQLPPSPSCPDVTAIEPSSHQPSTTPVKGFIHQLVENSLELDLGFSEEEKRLLLEMQALKNPWHQFVDNDLILKMGPVVYQKDFCDWKCFFTRNFPFHRKSRISRHHLLLLTEGAHLYLVDPVKKVLKREIPCSPQLWLETKTLQTFLIHTPQKTYHLIDPSGKAPKWCQKIQEVSGAKCRRFY